MLNKSGSPFACTHVSQGPAAAMSNSAGRLIICKIKSILPAIIRNKMQNACTLYTANVIDHLYCGCRCCHRRRIKFHVMSYLVESFDYKQFFNNKINSDTRYVTWSPVPLASTRSQRLIAQRQSHVCYSRYWGYHPHWRARARAHHTHSHMLLYISKYAHVSH